MLRWTSQNPYAVGGKLGYSQGKRHGSHSNTNAFQISATGVDYSHMVIEIVRNGYEAKALYAGRINNMELGFELLWKDQYDVWRSR